MQSAIVEEFDVDGWLMVMRVGGGLKEGEQA
jgi:hypothetical protein